MNFLKNVKQILGLICYQKYFIKQKKINCTSAFVLFLKFVLIQVSVKVNQKKRREYYIFLSIKTYFKHYTHNIKNKLLFTNNIVGIIAKLCNLHFGEIDVLIKYGLPKGHQYNFRNIT